MVDGETWEIVETEVPEPDGEMTQIAQPYF
jgi:hypothetical protein